MKMTGSEKRRFYRHPLSFPIQFAEAESPSRSTAIDISEGGICFLAERAIAKGLTVKLKIPVGDQIFTVDGHVAYSAKVANSNRYRTGVAFAGPSHAFRAKLAEEMLQVKIYQKKISQQMGVEISEEEAAMRWIEKYAKAFGELF